MIRTPVVIPAYEPDEKLLRLVEDLLFSGIQTIVIIRDGCSEDYNDIYNDIRKIPQCILLEHPANMGKGRAIKTAITYYLTELQHLDTGFVLADADGQHLPKDIIRVIEQLNENPNALVIGSREFHKKVPLRSRLGNIISRHAFSFLLGRKIVDTQSGLRGMPHTYLPSFVPLSGERYEFETNILIETKRQNIDIIEIPIETVYIESNQGSHFNPLLDSLRIYFLLIKYSISSISSFLLDYGLFAIFQFMLDNIAISSYLSRTISLIFNYHVNKNLVFRYFEKSWTFAKYLVLCLFSITISYIFVTSLYKLFGTNIYLSKLFIEIILFFFNFFIQSRFIFNKK